MRNTNNSAFRVLQAANAAPSAATRLNSDELTPQQGFRKTVSGVVGDSLQYLVGLAVLSVASVVLVPLYTRRLTQVEFGVFTLIDVSVLSILTVSSLGLNVAYVKWFAEVETSEVPALFSTVFVAGSVAGGVLGLALLLILKGDLGEHWLGTTTRGYAWMLFPIVVAETLENLLLAHLRAARRPIAFCGASSARLVAVVSASLWLLLVRHQGLKGVFLGRLSGDAVAIAVLIVLCADAIRLSFSWQKVIGMVRFGLPLVFSALIATLLDATPRYFLGHYGSMADVGLYGLGTKISGIIRIFLVAPFGIAWGGVMFQIAKEQSARAIYSKLLGYVFLLGMVAVALTDLFTPALLTAFAPPTYFEARRVVPLFLVTQAIAMLQYPASIGIYLRGSTKLFAPIYAGSLVLDLVLNWLLVPRFGLNGAALSWLIGWSVLVFSTALISQRLYSLHYEIKPFLVAAATWIGALLFRRVGVDGLSASGLACNAAFALAIASAVLWFVVSDFRSSAVRIENLPS